MSFNRIIIVGNLGRDPELRYTPQGTPVCSFTMATNDRRKDKNGEMQDQTTWFRVTLWNRQAETASQYLHKGKSVYIGSIWFDISLREFILLQKFVFSPVYFCPYLPTIFHVSRLHSKMIIVYLFSNSSKGFEMSSAEC